MTGVPPVDRGLSATEAVLAAACAVSREEHLAARMALIETGAAILRPIDLGLLVSGDGTAGGVLLGGPVAPWQHVSSAVHRHNVIRHRWKAAQVAEQAGDPS